MAEEEFSGRKDLLANSLEEFREELAGHTCGITQPVWFR
jgi:hypothetical protein